MVMARLFHCSLHFSKSRCSAILQSMPIQRGVPVLRWPRWTESEMARWSLADDVLRHLQRRKRDQPDERESRSCQTATFSSCHFLAWSTTTSAEHEWVSATHSNPQTAACSSRWRLGFWLQGCNLNTTNFLRHNNPKQSKLYKLQAYRHNISAYHSCAFETFYRMKKSTYANFIKTSENWATTFFENPERTKNRLASFDFFENRVVEWITPDRRIRLVAVFMAMKRIDYKSEG